MRLPHVSHSEQEAQLAIPLVDDGVPAEQQRLRALLGTGQFGEHDADHERLYHDADDALQAQHEYRLGTFLRRVPVSYTHLDVYKRQLIF